MNLYLHNYLDVFKRNFMLVVMALVLLAVTFFIWAGVPFFLIGSLVADLTSNFVIIYLCISLSGGFLFSFYFVPFNLKVAKNIGNIKGDSVTISFMYLQTLWIIVSSLIFGIVLVLMNVLQLKGAILKEGKAPFLSNLYNIGQVSGIVYVCLGGLENEWI
ncbi:hypothetical protein [Oceanobacillus saliphilus]|uniref:hypothetical protein n=1 Tax=Oceanobacillus saliphilus TaxID=2925834 RepID=UPI00201E7051|nr:hypothetical protein [Oceanobacillus saliphilus]